MFTVSSRLRSTIAHSPCDGRVRAERLWDVGEIAYVFVHCIRQHKRKFHSRPQTHNCDRLYNKAMSEFYTPLHWCWSQCLKHGVMITLEHYKSDHDYVLLNNESMRYWQDCENKMWSSENHILTYSHRQRIKSCHKDAKSLQMQISRLIHILESIQGTCRLSLKMSRGDEQKPLMHCIRR